MCSSPKLFAAYHVFHRLSVPRHPPCALLCLTSLVPPSPPGKEGCLPSALAYAAVGCMSSHASFSSVQALRLPGPELAFVLGESVCSYRIRTFRILDVVFSWNLIKKTFTVCSFQGTCQLPEQEALRSLITETSGLKWTRTTDLTLIRRAL